MLHSTREAKLRDTNKSKNIQTPQAIPRTKVRTRELETALQNKQSKPCNITNEISRSELQETPISQRISQRFGL